MNAVNVQLNSENLKALVVPSTGKIDGPTTGKVAFIDITPDMNYKYVDITKGCSFISAYANAETAYNDYIKKRRELKSSKIANSIARQSEEIKLMNQVMKCSLISLIQRLLSDKETEARVRSSPDILSDKAFLFNDAVACYFDVGLHLNITVNNPMDVYEKCVRDSGSEIKNVAFGCTKLNDNDARIHSQTHAYFYNRLLD